MSRIRLYFDEDAMDPDLVRALRARDADVITARALGMIERRDEDQLRTATQQGRVLYSFNLADYYRLHTEWMASGRFHAGMILAQQQRHSVGDQLRRLVRLLGNRTAEEMRNWLEFLSTWGEV